MKTPEMTVLEFMLRGLTPAQLSTDPLVRAAAADEAQALNRRLSKLNREAAKADTPEGAEHTALAA